MTLLPSTQGQLAVAGMAVLVAFIVGVGAIMATWRVHEAEVDLRVENRLTTLEQQMRKGCHVQPVSAMLRGRDIDEPSSTSPPSPR